MTVDFEGGFWGRTIEAFEERIDQLSYFWGAWYKAGPTAPLQVYRLTLEAASKGEIRSREVGPWRFPIFIGSVFGMAEAEHSFHNPFPQVSVIEGATATATALALRAAIGDRNGHMKRYSVSILDIPTLEMSAVWLHHANEDLFYKIGASEKLPGRTSHGDFTADIVKRALAKLG